MKPHTTPNKQSTDLKNPSEIEIWSQLPKPPARCPYSSLSRSKICELILPCMANNFRPPVASRSLKSSKHAKRGIRLYSVNSLLAYIAEQPTDNTPS
jgi:hypothetical protein